VTQQQCDQEAERLTGLSVHPATSYTVVSDDETCVVQFRTGSFSLDIDLLKCVEQGYMGFMPRHQWVGYLGELHVYTMSNVGGISMYLARDQLCKNDFSLLPSTSPPTSLRSLSPRQSNQLLPPHRFFLPRHGITRQARCSVQAAPRCVTSTCRNSRSSSEDCPCAFARCWTMSSRAALKTIGRWCPTTLTSWSNVSKETGHMTGICDWKDTAISPFGMSLNGLETVLGIRTVKESWHYHANQQELCSGSPFTRPWGIFLRSKRS